MAALNTGMIQQDMHLLALNFSCSKTFFDILETPQAGLVKRLPSWPGSATSCLVAVMEKPNNAGHTPM